MKLGTRSKRILVGLALMPLMVLLTKAQSSLAFYPMENQFNSSNYNPAFLTSREKFSFSIFPLGGTSVSYNNRDIIEQFVTNSISRQFTDNDYKENVKRMADRSSFNQNGESSLLNFTFRSKVGFFNFQIKENESFSAVVKGDVTDFIIKTGIQSAFINQVQNLPAQLMHYREYSFGYTLPAGNNKFTAGIRTKIYFGKAAFFSGISGSIQDESDNYALKTGGKVYMSIPGVKIFNNDGTINSISVIEGVKSITYFMNSGNPGIGVDLGIKYRITPDLSFSLSVIDMGKINWKTNLNSKSFNGKYNLPPESVRYSTTDVGAEIITKTGNNSFIDSISSIFDLEIDSSAFSRPMPVTVYAGLKYQLNPSLKISLVDRYVILKNMNYNSFSIMVSFDVNKKLSVNTGYEIIGNSYYNIPLALLFNRNFGQIYIGTDNLVSFILPSISDFAGFTFGTCFYLFKKRNLLNSTSDDYPFYKPRKIKKNPKTGKILKEYPES